MANSKLNDRDIEDIENLIGTIANSYGIEFQEEELIHLRTFGELCSMVTAKVEHMDHIDDCTTQQAFYKLRHAIATVLGLDKSTITNNAQIRIIFPRHSRRKQIKQVEMQLGFALNILRPRHFISYSLLIGLAVSLAGLLFYWKFAFPGILIAFTGLIIAFKFANTFDLETIGQVADKISRENYLKSRRNPASVNKKEIEKKIQDLFAESLDLPKTALTKDAAFV
jgi:acyl carrier protein